MLLLSRTRFTQPQGPVEINRANPITRSLSICVPLGSVTKNAVPNGALQTSASGVSPVTSIVGLASSFSGSTNGIVHEFNGPSFPITISAKIFAAGVGGGAVCALTGPSGGDNWWLHSLELSATTIFSTTASGGSTDVSMSYTLPATGVWYDAALVVASATDRRLYINGVLVATSTVSRSFSTFAEARIGSIGGNWNGSSKFNGIAASVNVWKRALIPPEIASISTNPWQIFAPVEQRIWVPYSNISPHANIALGSILVPSSVADLAVSSTAHAIATVPSVVANINTGDVTASAPVVTQIPYVVPNIPSYATSQPYGLDIDPKALARGLVVAWNGTTPDVSYYRGRLRNVGTSSITRRAYSGRADLGMHATAQFAASASESIDLGALTNWAPLTILVLTEGSSVNNMAIATRGAAGLAGVDVLVGSGGNSGNWALRSTTTDIAVTTGLNNGKLNTAILRMNGSTFDGWINDTYGSAGVGTVEHTQNLYIGRRGTTYYTGNVALVLVWERALSDAEIALIRKHPYSVFKNPKHTLLSNIVAASSGGVASILGYLSNLYGQVISAIGSAITTTSSSQVSITNSAISSVGSANTTPNSSMSSINNSVISGTGSALTTPASNITVSYINAGLGSGSAISNIPSQVYTFSLANLTASAASQPIGYVDGLLCVVNLSTVSAAAAALTTMLASTVSVSTQTYTASGSALTTTTATASAQAVQAVNASGSAISSSVGSSATSFVQSGLGYASASTSVNGNLVSQTNSTFTASGSANSVNNSTASSVTYGSINGSSSVIVGFIGVQQTSALQTYTASGSAIPTLISNQTNGYLAEVAVSTIYPYTPSLKVYVPTLKFYNVVADTRTVNMARPAPNTTVVAASRTNILSPSNKYKILNAAVRNYVYAASSRTNVFNTDNTVDILSTLPR